MPTQDKRSFYLLVVVAVVVVPADMGVPLEVDGALPPELAHEPGLVSVEE